MGFVPYLIVINFSSFDADNPRSISERAKIFSERAKEIFIEFRRRKRGTKETKTKQRFISYTWGRSLLLELQLHKSQRTQSAFQAHFEEARKKQTVCGPHVLSVLADVTAVRFVLIQVPLQVALLRNDGFKGLINLKKLRLKHVLAITQLFLSVNWLGT